MSIITLSNICKSYNPGLFKKKIQAVAELSFEIHQGEVFGLIGPNGAGKSTTIKMLLGLIRPDSGTILFRGKPLGETAIQGETGYLPENPYLYDHLTLLELLNFCGQTSGLSRERINARGQELMAKLSLLEARNRPLRTFSKGMLQRAGICFALLHDPSIVILDEPMSGLDPLGRSMVFDLVMELKGQGKTIFFCSHILNDVERLCDRIGLMNKGRLVREFERKDFLQNAGQTVFLQVSVLDQALHDELLALGITLRPEATGHLLAIPTGRYFATNHLLEKSAIEILGCRSEWKSLEDLFMQAVKEQDQ
jgi:ABC-2 type transport system ATP-binding protein